MAEQIGYYYGYTMSGDNVSDSDHLYVSVNNGNTIARDVERDINNTYYVTIGASIFLVDNSMMHTPQSCTEGFGIVVDGDMNNAYFTGKTTKSGVITCNWTNGGRTVIVVGDVTYVPPSPPTPALSGTVGLKLINSVPPLIGYPFNDPELEHGSVVLSDGETHEYVVIYHDVDEEWTIDGTRYVGHAFEMPRTFTCNPHVKQLTIPLESGTVTRDKATHFYFFDWFSDEDYIYGLKPQVRVSRVSETDVSKNIETAYLSAWETTSIRLDYYSEDVLVDVRYGDVRDEYIPHDGMFRLENLTDFVPVSEGRIFSGWLAENGLRFTSGYTLFSTDYINTINQGGWDKDEYDDSPDSPDNYTLAFRLDADYDNMLDAEHTPRTYIRIYKESEDAHSGEIPSYVNVTGMLAVAPSIQLAENQAGSARFTLINKYDGDSSKLPVSDDFNGWATDYVGAVKCGMTVHIYNQLDDDGNLEQIFDGIISTISLEGERMNIECADGIARLGKVGSDIRRNYRANETIGYFDAESTKDKDGNDVVFAVLDDTGENGELVTPVAYGWNNGAETNQRLNALGTSTQLVMGGDAPTTVYVPVDFETGVWSAAYIQPSYGGLAEVTATLRSSDGKTYTATGRGSQVTKVYHTSDSRPSGYWRGTIGVPVTFSNVEYSDSFTLTVNSVEPISKVFFEYGGVQASYSTGYDTEIQWSNPIMSIEGDWKEENRPNGKRLVFYPSDIEKYPAGSKKLYVLYVKENTSVVEIASDLVSMSNMRFYDENVFAYEGNALPTDAGSLAVFRVGGGFLADYLRKLTDCYDTEGEYKGVKRAFTVHGINPTEVSIGRRYSAEDDPLFCLHYGGDEPENLPDSVIDSFAYSSSSLSKTFKHRPNRVTYYAEVNDSNGSSSVPVTIVDNDSGNVRGLNIESVETGSASSWKEVVQSCWNDLSYNELDKWEGTITIPMSLDARSHLTEFIAQSGDYIGSGAPVIIYDKRYGMDGYRARIRQMSVDYPSCTISFTLTNYSSMYSSDISDSIALAVTKGTVGAVTDTALWSRQYVSLYISRNNVDVGSDLSISKTTTSTRVVADKTDWARLPNGDYLVIGRFLANATNQFFGRYEVRYAYVGNERVSIQYRNPDFLVGQTLIVCVQIHPNGTN